MIFLRQLYKQKPKQWGPISAVRAAVYRNAEEIYGIDPASIIIACPYWEHNYREITTGKTAAAKALYGGDATKLRFIYGSDGYPDRLFSYYSAYYYDIKQPSTAVDELSIVISFNNYIDSSYNRGFLDAKGADTSNWSTTKGYSLSYRADGGILWMVADQDTYTTTDYVEDNKDHNLAVSWKAGDHQDIYIDGSEVSYDKHVVASSYTAIDDYLRIGTYYDGWSNNNYRMGSALYSFTHFKQALNQDQIGLFNDLPYQLFAPNPGKLYFDMGLATSTGTVVSVDTGTITLTGQTVGVIADVNLSVDTGSISFAGKAANIHAYIQAVTGAITLTGKTVLENVVVTPLKGAITLTGKVVNIISGNVESVDKGDITLTGKDTNIHSYVNPTTGLIRFIGKVLDMGDMVKKGLTKMGNSLRMK